MMDYDAVLAQVLALLQREQRLSYRVLKLRLQLDDDTLEALKEDLVYAKQLAVDEDGRVLVWTGGAEVPLSATAPVPQSASRFEKLTVVPSERCQSRGGRSSISPVARVTHTKPSVPWTSKTSSAP